MKWSVKLSEFDIHYESRKALKAHVFVDFIAKMTIPAKEKEAGIVTIFVDGSSNFKGSGVDIIIENDEGIVINLSIGLSIAMTNNTTEYEAFLAGLRVVKEMGTKRVKICTDFQLVAFQVTGEYQVREEHQEFVHLVQTMMKEFDSVDVVHVSRE